MPKFTVQEKIIHDQFVAYGRNAREWMRKCVLLLLEIERKEIWKKKGFESIYVYAAKLAGMSRNTVDDALRILNKIENMPDLMRIVRQRGLGAVRPVIGIVTIETQTFWAGKARQMSKNTLEMYVQEYKKAHPEAVNGLNDVCAKIQNGLFEPINTDFRGPGTEILNITVNGQVVESGQGEAKSADRGAAVSIETFVQNVGAGAEVNAYEDQSDDLAPTIHKKVVAMDLEPVIIEQLEKLKGQGSWNDLMKQLLVVREQQLRDQRRELEAQKPQVKVARTGAVVPVASAKTPASCVAVGLIAEVETACVSAKTPSRAIPAAIKNM